MDAYPIPSATVRSIRDGRRPRLVMTPAVPYVQVPTAVLKDGQLSPGARVLYGLMAAYWWGSGECRASHETLADDMGIKPRQLRRYASELVESGHVTERPHGRGQAKAYAPNRTYMSDYEDPNRSDVTALEPQQVIYDLANRSDMTTEVDRGRTGVIVSTGIDTSETPALQAEPIPTQAEKTEKTTRKATVPKRTRAPESFKVTETLASWAEGVGLNRARLDSETERFLDYHRGKGSLQADWTATWRTWMRRAVEYGPRTAPSRNGTMHGERPSPSDPTGRARREALESNKTWGRKRP